MATKALLDQNPAPDDAAVRKALARNLCRCTGYIKIIDAVKLAGRFIRGETTPDQVRQNIGTEMIGSSHPRFSSMLKACGLAKFTADIELKDALELAVVHSTEHHAIIKSIDTSVASKMPGVAGIVTAADIKGTNRIRVYVPDQPVLCEDRVRTFGDPIAIVAAKTNKQAREAAAAVRVAYEPLPVMMTAEQALAKGAYQIHRHWPNMCHVQPLIKGDVNKALIEAESVVEATFTTQMVHQAPVEPEACVSYIEGEGENAQLVVIGRSINIHGHAKQLKEALGWENIRYIEAFVGGQFGIKSAITSEGIAAAACLHFKRPVRYIPSLAESMLISTKRHPFTMKIKMGASAEGKITACKGEIIINKGAYYIIGTKIVDRLVRMLAGPYHIPNFDVVVKQVYTNNASGGAARGAGPPQATFAIESLVDMLVEKLGADPLEFRKNNSLKPGQTLATGTVQTQWPFPELCEAIRPYYEQAKQKATLKNQINGSLKYGVGLSCHAFGIGEPEDKAQLFVELNSDDGVTIYGAVSDPGEGNDSMLTKIAAHLLNLPLGKARLYTRDTDKTVGMGPAAGSRMTYMAGGALVDSIEQLKQAMKEAGTKTYEGMKKAGKLTRYQGTRINDGSYHLNEKTGQGDAFHSHVQNIQMAEVEVNTGTGEVKVLKMTMAVDAGRVIHPHNFEGQLEGGLDQGIGFALREEYVHGKTKDWVTFKFPTIQTACDVEFIIRQTPRAKGTLGSTGIGEMTMTSTAPAVINAIRDACGIRIFDLPATPERIKEALKASK